jgi:quinoprotein dehydrogenase-associated probable ABC transporter substrate-binding protein
MRKTGAAGARKQAFFSLFAHPVFASVLLAQLPAPASPPLRVCADPNNLPFSNQREQGFENRLAQLVARDLDTTVEYTWFSQRQSFIKNSLNAGLCDALMGVPSTVDSVAVTRPYYRSTYVFVSRKSRNLQLSSLDDLRLANWRIGLHVVGADYAPPAVVLARHGLAANIRGYSLSGAFGESNPPGRLIDAVAAGDVDVAIVWGPFAGYFARRESTPLAIAPVSPAIALGVPFTFDISMAVRKDDEALRSRLDRALLRHCAQVRSILDDYGIPLVTASNERNACVPQP